MPTYPSPLLAVAPRIYAVLNVAALTALATGGVFNVIPQTRTYPLVRVGDWQSTHRPLMNRDGAVIAFNVHASSKAQKPSDVINITILSKARELLHYQPITITGWDVVNLRDSDDEPNGTEEIGGEIIVHRVTSFELDVLKTLP